MDGILGKDTSAIKSAPAILIIATITVVIGFSLEAPFKCFTPAAKIGKNARWGRVVACLLNVILLHAHATTN